MGKRVDNSTIIELFLDKSLQTKGKTMTATNEYLSAIMDFDHVIEIHEDGTISDAPGVYGPDLIQEEVSEGVWEESLEGNSWSLLSGFSGQHSYRGPMMHSSEYIGGVLADHILARPGYYVAIYPTCIDINGETVDEDSWAVAYKAVN